MSRRAWYGTALAVLGILIIAGLIRLRFDVDVLNLLPNDLPVVEGLKLFQQKFTDSRELIITIRSTDAARTEAAAKSLATNLRGMTNLTSSVIWQPAWLEKPSDTAELIGYLWLNQPPPEFDALANRLTGTNIAAALADAREQLATSLSPMDLARRGYDPYDLTRLPDSVTGMAASFGGGSDMFASADGRFRIIFVRARPDISNYRACIAWLNEIKSKVQAFCQAGEIPKDVVLGYTGGPAFLAEISGGMEHDMTASVGITSVIIAILFWIFHRRWVPMLWLLTLLALILASTLALGGLIFGAINVVSLGFAGILLGLAVDYGVVHYQEALASPNAIIPEIRQAIRPSIFWAAVTTISAFLVLNFGGLPGLAQLGSLVALGVMLSALVMLFAFLPPLFRDRLKRRTQPPDPQETPVPHPENEKPDPVPRWQTRTVFGSTAALALGAIVILCFGIPRLDHSDKALRPRNSPSYAALDEISNELAHRESLWLITRGRDELGIAHRLDAAKLILERAVSNHLISSFILPTPLWPRPDFQEANRATAAKIIAGRETLRDAALAAGFSAESLVMMDNIFNTWRTALAHGGTFWPTNELSQWILEKSIARTNGEFFAAGFIFRDRTAINPSLTVLPQELSNQGFILSGWELLGPAILKRVQQNLWKVVLPMVALVLASLWLAFRRPAEIMLSLSVLLLSGLCLLAVMRLAGWSWNLLNLMALPLMLGSGVDYSIFMQLALRRHHGNLSGAHRSVGRALLLCGGTAIAGFGSLSLSTNAGMASLGEVCATGIGGNMLISVFLLPIWWRKLGGGGIENQKPLSEKPNLHSPSLLYRSGVWRLGLGLTRMVPPKICAWAARSLATGYWLLIRQRREIVIQNLLPPLNGNRAAAELEGRRLIQQFATKVVDLLRYESGEGIEHLFGEWSGWEHFTRAQKQKRGILLITPHLGNWEFGGPLLTRRGVKLQVITLAEPGGRFTDLRKASRARWDIDTLVIGEDPFAFVEIIRRLEAGATVALLMDRPPTASRVIVELFGRPFPASVAAAELARASGCVLLPVYIPQIDGSGYAAHMLPAIEYDRGALREREARQKLTQKIMSAFEAPIRNHLNQWYHFVPVWPDL